jgi:hypothetical protein
MTQLWSSRTECDLACHTVTDLGLYDGAIPALNVQGLTEILQDPTRILHDPLWSCQAHCSDGRPTVVMQGPQWWSYKAQCGHVRITVVVDGLLWSCKAHCHIHYRLLVCKARPLVIAGGPLFFCKFHCNIGRPIMIAQGPLWLCKIHYRCARHTVIV